MSTRMAPRSRMDSILGHIELIPVNLKEQITLAHARYESSQSLADLDELLALWRAVFAFSEGESFLALAERETLGLQALQAIHIGLEERSTLTGDAQTNLDERIDTLHRLSELFDSLTPAYTRMLGTALHGRYRLRNNVEDLDAAIAAFRRAFHLDSNDPLSSVACLIAALRARGRAFDRRGDLDEATELASLVLENPSFTESHERLASFSENEHFSRFIHSGDAGDLDSFLSMSRRLSPAGVSELSAYFRGIALEHRFNHSGESFDLDLAIKHYTSLLDRGVTDINYELNVLDRLSWSYTRRFLENGWLASDIDNAIDSTIRAIALLNSDDPKHRIRTRNLAYYYTCRAKTNLHVKADLDMASKLFLSLKRPDEGDHIWYMLYEQCLRSRFRFLKDIAAMRERIIVLEECVRRCPDGEERHITLHSLALARNDAFFYDATHRDPAAFVLLEHFVPPRAKEVIMAYVDAYNAITAAGDSSGWLELRVLEDFTEFCAQCILVTTALVPDIAETLMSPGVVKDMLARFVYRTSEAMGLGHTLSRRYKEAARLQFTLGATVAIMLLLGENDTALEWFEQGRAVVWSQIQNLRTPLEYLRAVHPDLAGELEKLSLALENAGRRAPLPSHGPSDIFAFGDTASVGDTVSVEEQAVAGRRLAREHTELLERIRSEDGFRDFLRPRRAALLLKAAESHAVACINVHQVSDALIIFGSNMQHVRLPNLRPDKVEEWHGKVTSFLRRVRARAASDESRKGEVIRDPRQPNNVQSDPIRDVLREMWHCVVRPILVVYQSILEEGRAHITWCTTGKLAFLPLHAAGRYDGESLNTFDIVVSSYSPNLTSLLPPTTELRSISPLSSPTGAQHSTPFSAPLGTVDVYAKAGAPHAGESQNAVPPVVSSNASDPSGVLPAATEIEQIPSPSILVVAQPNTPRASSLPGTKKEAGEVMKRFSGTDSDILIGEDGTTTAVIERMAKHPYIHLACHGKQDADPMKSAFLLHDGPLTLHKLMEHKSSNAQLAFLSACETATGDEQVPNEAVHLAACMLAAGYKSVVATMWSIGDTEAPRVADEFYRALLADPEHNVAFALHDAVKALRESKDVGVDNFVKWMPFIHLGM